MAIIFVSLLSIANIKIFREWGTLLNSRALKYMLYPKEALTFISFWQVTSLISLFIFFSFIGIVFYNKFIKNNPSTNKNSKKLVIELLIIPVFLFTAARGGIQLSPINESSSYYSNIQVNNMIATNNIWYLAHSIIEAGDERNPYAYSDIKNAKKITAGLFKTSSEKTPNILKITKPNIVFIVLESWTADIIKRLGGEENVTPHFDEISKDGLLFTQMYGSGFRTEQGLVSIFSGFPAQPNNSIITTPSKSEKLPSISIELAKKGYQFSFYYGGEIEFANMKSYLLNSNFEKIIDKKDFRKDQLNSKWGAHDEFVFEKQLDGLKNEKEPFCSVVLTLSSHEPFEVTMNTPFNGSEESERFKKAAYYSDDCLFKYFENAKKQAWYKNTIFILVADHGHRLPKNRDMNMPEGRRISALITGGALLDSLRGKTVNKICNQNDIAATLLEQLHMDHSDFVWSKDVFNPETQEFAYYSNENVLGWITPQQNIVFTYTTKSVNTIQPKTQKILNDTILTQAKSYLQTLYQAYLDY
ncbi:MAG: LTA synthase family protein [Bacteroidetes bacterium]|nr:LTA synthase family protein [Bacteroidota bacterium]